MPDLVLLDGDLANFQPTFGPAVVVVRPGNLKGSGPATAGGKKVCVDGDEKQLQVPGCAYTTPQFSIPGVGTLKVASLGGDQKATKTNTGGKALLLKGGTFTARFEVQSPAKQPTPSGPPLDDPAPQYSGSGTFVTTNLKFQAT
jgi:hypothetical protein